MQKYKIDDDFLVTPRFMACAIVLESKLETVLDGPLAEEFNADRAGILEDDEYGQLVGLSDFVPRI